IVFCSFSFFANNCLFVLRGKGTRKKKSLLWTIPSTEGGVLLTWALSNGMSAHVAPDRLSELPQTEVQTVTSHVMINSSSFVTTGSNALRSDAKQQLDSPRRPQSTTLAARGDHLDAPPISSRRQQCHDRHDQDAFLGECFPSSSIHPLSEGALVTTSSSMFADDAVGGAMASPQQQQQHTSGAAGVGVGSSSPQPSASGVRRVVGRLRHFDEDGEDSNLRGHHRSHNTSSTAQQQRHHHHHHNQHHAAALSGPPPTGVFRTAAHPTAHTIPIPSPHGSSENWGMIRRFGFPCSQDSAVCDAEHHAYQTFIAHALANCESLWSAALRGVPLLANATDETNAPLRKLCLRCGIPGHLRGVVWLTLSGVALRLEENEMFCASLLHRFGVAPDAEAVDSIEKDIDRTFPQHPYYAQEFDVGQAKLRRVLHALCWRNPMLNYCQSFNFLAATLLLVTDDEDATFWLMVLLLETILPNDYYGEGLIGAKVDQEVVSEIIALELPTLAAHFDDIRFDVRALVPSWLLSMFVNVFPFDTVIRIWDVICTHADLTAYSRSGKKFGVTGAHHNHGLSPLSVSLFCAS
ncbi:Hypothetical protein, putative, partial [Bodo saltans]